jgi:hypothetical protein
VESLYCLCKLLDTALSSVWKWPAQILLHSCWFVTSLAKLLVGLEQICHSIFVCSTLYSLGSYGCENAELSILPAWRFRVANAIYALWRLVLKIDVNAKWRKYSSDETIGTSQLQWMFEVASIHLKADDSAPHATLAHNTLALTITTPRRLATCFLRYSHGSYSSQCSRSQVPIHVPECNPFNQCPTPSQQFHLYTVHCGYDMDFNGEPQVISKTTQDHTRPYKAIQDHTHIFSAYSKNNSIGTIITIIALTPH